MIKTKPYLFIVDNIRGYNSSIVSDAVEMQPQVRSQAGKKKYVSYKTDTDIAELINNPKDTILENWCSLDYCENAVLHNNFSVFDTEKLKNVYTIIHAHITFSEHTNYCNHCLTNEQNVLYKTQKDFNQYNMTTSFYAKKFASYSTEICIDLDESQRDCNSLLFMIKTLLKSKRI